MTVQAEPTKVFVVTQGEYSSYRIVAVFSTEDKAKEFVANIGQTSTYDGPDIETFEIDPPNVWGYVTSLYMDRDGKSWGGTTRRVHLPQTSHRIVSEGRALYVEIATSEQKASAHYDQAVKVANEIRTQLIATMQWPLPGDG